MKKFIISIALVIGFVLGSVPLSANAENLTKTDVNSENQEIIEVITERVLSDNEKLMDDNEPTTYGAIGYETFERTKEKERTMELRFTSTGAIVGFSKVKIAYRWYETWKVNSSGGKISLESRTSPKIYSSFRDYGSIPGVTISETSWDNGKGTNKAQSLGNISSVWGGTRSWSNTVIAD
ncbi:hypothetical protein CLPU_1c02650 [Gottschalkia purinilytica]|uniref:DUF5626 domain-containing protein n=1 Tax=Gottschalkia purinilytica TaxID=1503 RepID=A0A0L0WFA3_GOTPU|nr:hypothetical protein [Gottschalkia purinilytica]KNF10100.1 hypothetical protein CLPU_1c02650 [Gottschalkia purinilytica]